MLGAEKGELGMNFVTSLDEIQFANTAPIIKCKWSLIRTKFTVWLLFIVLF